MGIQLVIKTFRKENSVTYSRCPVFFRRTWWIPWNSSALLCLYFVWWCPACRELECLRSRIKINSFCLQRAQEFKTHLTTVPGAILHLSLGFHALYSSGESLFSPLLFLPSNIVEALMLVSLAFLKASSSIPVFGVFPLNTHTKIIFISLWPKCLQEGNSGKEG